MLEWQEAPLTLVTWRMEQRERRPLKEQVRDAVEVSLEVEKATLIDAPLDSSEVPRKCLAVE